MNRQTQKENTHKKVYQAYMDLLFVKRKNEEGPSLAEVSEKTGISRQRIEQIMKRMVEEGYLIKLKEDQRVLYRPVWIERHTKI